MMKRILHITLFLCFCLVVQAEVRTNVPCGEWLTIKAQPRADFRFIQWSDGNTDSVRTVQVYEDATYIAFFAANCEEYANWPVIALYDWLLMINKAAINAKGYYFNEENVTWYRIVGEPDDMHDSIFPQDDQVVVRNSFYLTLDQDLKGTGNYYAVVDVSNAHGKYCDGLMRSVIINYSGTGNGSAPQVRLMPTCAAPGQQLKLVGMDPDETTTVQIFSSAGQLVRSFVCEDSQAFFPAEYTAGCYQVRVSSNSVKQVIKYFVRQ